MLSFRLLTEKNRKHQDVCEKCQRDAAEQCSKQSLSAVIIGGKNCPQQHG